MNDWDMLIRNGMVIDGSGVDRFVADIAIADGVIRQIGMGLPVNSLMIYVMGY